MQISLFIHPHWCLQIRVVPANHCLDLNVTSKELETQWNDYLATNLVMRQYRQKDGPSE
jgi:hypothetical protein